MSLSSAIRNLLGIPDVPSRAPCAHPDSDQVRGPVRQALAKNAAAHRHIADEAFKAHADSMTAMIAVSELVDFMSAPPKDKKHDEAPR